MKGRRSAIVEQPKRKKAKAATQGEQLVRRQLVIQYILSGLPLEQIARQLVADYGIHPDTARDLYRTVLAEMRNGQDEQLRNARVEVIHRLRRDIAAMRNPGQMRDRDGRLVWEEVHDELGNVVKVKGKAQRRPVPAPIDFARIVAHERLLAQIEGTLEPIKVQVDADVTLRRSILAVVANLTPDAIDALASEDEELQRKALGRG